MNPRINYATASSEPLKAMLSIEKYLATALEPALLHLVKLRASQMNGCAYCIDMHWKDARAGGETEQRLYGLDAWRESPYYTDKERAALAWTESLTRIAETHAPDEDFEEVRTHFDDQELADLTWAIAAINTWNRISIALRTTPGSYKPRTK